MRKILPYVTVWVLALATMLWAEAPKKAGPPAVTKPAPAAQSSTLPTPLSADQFQGRVREAYKAAGEIPDVFAGVACYCGCNKSRGHRNLLDCFVDDHGAG